MPLPDWARAYRLPLVAASIRSTPADFDVTEELGYAFDGEGEHDYLYVEKTGTNTEWLSRQLATFADVPARDVGYSGLKDRNAVTRQWFSVPRWHSPNWSDLNIEGAKLLDVQRHSKKLRRGAHKANHFKIILRPDTSEPEKVSDLFTNTKNRSDTFSKNRSDTFSAFSEVLRSIGEYGVPNYYGEQRFGRDGGNIRLADDWAAGKRLPRHKRSIAISSARSYLFNEYLHDRVLNGTWNRIQPGDVANLDGTGSVFTVDDVDEDIVRRCDEMDLHPAAELAGDGSSSGHEPWQRALDKGRVKPGTRSLRLRVRELQADMSQDQVALEFTLGRGAFATAVLREIVRYQVRSGTT